VGTRVNEEMLYSVNLLMFIRVGIGGGAAASAAAVAAAAAAAAAVSQYISAAVSYNEREVYNVQPFYSCYAH
jgi:hypothetical protein